jgi:conjugative relaxase-like TrwC/TraI family protein
MAWVTTLGPAVVQVEYRLVHGGGCGQARARAGEPALGEGQDLAEPGETTVVVDRVLAYRMDGSAERSLTWIGHGLEDLGLGEAGVVAGGGLVTEEHREMARALMAGTHPVTGEVLLKPKVAADPRGKVPAAAYVKALRDAADARGVTVARLTTNVKAGQRIGRLVRGVAGEGDTHQAPVKDLEAVAAATGVALEDAYDSDVLERARQFADAKVGVGNRGYDLTLDLPKSVSLLHGLSAAVVSQRVKELFVGVVTETVTAMEGWAAYGMSGHHGGGRVATRVDSRGFAGWVMWHDVARSVDGQPPDPHLHAHVVLANLVHGEDGTWYAPGNGGRELHRHAQAAGALTQARMRRELSAGYGIEWTRDPHSGAWEIVVIGRDVRTVLSKRDGQVIGKLREEGIDPAAATRAQAKVASAKSREAKHAAPAAEPVVGEPLELRAHWRDQLAAAGIDASALAASALRPGQGVGEDLAPDVIAGEIFDPERGLTAHRKRIGRADLITAVCDTMPAGVTSLDHAQDLVDLVLKLPVSPVVELPRGPSHLTHNQRYTTPDILAAELSGLAAARTGYAGDSAVLPRQAAEAAMAAFARARGFELSAEQRQVAMRLLTSGHAVDAVIGVAGSGKTVLMQVIHQAYQAGGKTVRGTSTAAVAAAGLQAQTGIGSATIASWLRKISRGDGLAGVDVLVVDEGAMVDDRALAALLEAAKVSGTKVIAIGDPMQLKAVGVGGLFAGIHRQVDGAMMLENRRQRDPHERKALQLWRDGHREQALAEWERSGHVHDGQLPADTMAALITEWERTRTAMYAGHAPGVMDVHEELGRLLILAGTHADVQELNAAARAMRREAGEIVGDDRHYRREDGTSIALAIGDHVWVRQNDYRSRGPNADPDAVDVLNGYRGRLTGIRESDGAVLVEWRRLAPGGTTTIEQQWLSARYIAAGGLTHGTAMTVASAQGMTSDVSLVYGLGLDPNSFYSAMSRARDRTQLYLPRVALENDVDRILHGPVTNGDHSLARTLVAYGRTLTGGPDTLVATELGLEPEPIAHQQPQPPGPEADPARILRAQQVGQVDFPQRRPQRRPTAGQAQEGQQRHPFVPAGQVEQTAAAGQAQQEGREDHRPLRPQIPHWRQRPYGDLDPQDLADTLQDARQRRQRLIERAERALTDAHADLLTAREGGGPHTAALHAQRQQLQAAAAAGARARDLEARIKALHAADRQDSTEIRRLRELKQRNPIYLLMLRKTTRGQLTAQINDLAEQRGNRNPWSGQAAVKEAREQARHLDPQIASARGDGGHLDRRNDNKVLQDLRELTDNWPDWVETALAGDVAAAQAQIHAARTQLDDATSPSDTITDLSAEIAIRQTLPPPRASREAAQRADHHRHQAEQQRIAAEQRREQQRQEEQHRPYHGYDGPSHGHSLSR